MNIFKQAFNRERTPDIQRGGRDLNDLFKGPLPYMQNYLKAMDYYKSNYFDLALMEIQRTIELSDIYDLRHYAFKANILKNKQNYTDAINFYLYAIDISDSDISVYALYHEIGICFLFSRNNEKAIEFLTYAIELKKMHPNSEFDKDHEYEYLGVVMGLEMSKMLVNRGNAHKNIGNFNLAITDCNTALQIDNKNSNPYVLMFQIYEALGDGKTAMHNLITALNLGNPKAKQIYDYLNQ